MKVLKKYSLDCKQSHVLLYNFGSRGVHWKFELSNKERFCHTGNRCQVKEREFGLGNQMVYHPKNVITLSQKENFPSETVREYLLLQTSEDLK